ncbi:hypothetical protein vseg_014896 [Gypsophila vaccaria]
MAQMKSAEVVEVKDEEVSFLGKLTKDVVKSNETRSQNFRTQSTFVNFSKRALRMSELHHWHGESEHPGLHYILLVGVGARFIQRGNLPEGVKFGVVYSDDTTGRRFIVAVNAPAHKVYVESGPINGRVDWYAMEVKLNNASSGAVHNDPIFGGKITASTRHGDYDYPTTTATFEN